MIIDKTVNVLITSRNITKYKKLGYLPIHGEQLNVLVKDAGYKTKIRCKCDNCGIEYHIIKSYLNDVNSKYCRKHSKTIYDNKRKLFWNSEDGIKIRKAKGLKISKTKKGQDSVNFGERNGNWNPNKSEYKNYQYKVISYTRANFKNEVENLENFSRRGLAGVPGAYQIDHKVSILYGFENNINPEIIGHIENLEMIPWESNRAKSNLNSISITELNMLISKYKGNLYES